MNVVNKSAKTKDEALIQVLKELNAQEEEVSYKFSEVKGGLFKGITYECVGFLKIEVVSAVEDFLREIVKGMGLEVNIETIKKDNAITFKMYTSNNPLIIGKNGQNLEALNILVSQYVKNISSDMPRFILDVEDYKDRQLAKLERLAKNLAREVIKTKVDVEMDSMNSFERRVVHNVLNDFKNIKTESIGEEPDRRVVIKYSDNNDN